MSNSYYDMTGLLFAKAITPMLEALFGGFKLEQEENGPGTVGFRVMAESESMSWQGIITQLQTHAETLGFKVDEDDSPDAPATEVIGFLVKQFNAEGNKALQDVIEQTDFDGDASMDALFQLACAFDDGHQLKGIQYEGAWHSDKARLFHFGGNGGFISKNVFFAGDSTSFTYAGQEMDAAIEQDDEVAAAGVIGTQLSNMLDAINCPAMSYKVRAALLELLSSEQEALSRVPNVDSMGIEGMQQMVAETIFDRFKFGEAVEVLETSGWAYTTPGHEWTRAVFVSSQTGQADSEKWTFTVRFQPDSAIVEEAFALDCKGQPCGSYETVEYYVWTGDGDCQNKTAQLAEALQWCHEFVVQGKGAYITNVDNEVLDFDELIK